MRKVLSLLLAIILLIGAGPAAQAAERMELRWENSNQAGRIYLDLRNLDLNAYGIQLELTLDGSYPDCVFRADSRDAYSPDCTVEVRQRKTDVTVYLTDTKPLNERADLALGTLDLGTRESVRTDVLPDNAYIIVLDRDLSGSSVRIPVTGTGRNEGTGGNTGNSGNTGNTGSTGGTNGRPGTESRPSNPDPAPPAQNNPSQPDTGTNPAPLLFADVQEKDWFYDAVQFVYARGMMNGTGESTFTPYATTTRGMIVTILHRLEGSPAAGAPAFGDVPAGEYYAAPVAWASANGIVNGYSDTEFQPDTPITREQMAAILYRYAQYKKVDVSRKNDLLQYGDRAQVSPYAVDAISWAVEAGLVTGIDGRLEPAGSANRAQAATILMRLCQRVLV